MRKIRGDWELAPKKARRNISSERQVAETRHIKCSPIEITKPKVEEETRPHNRSRYLVLLQKLHPERNILAR
jgi:hypothetical protein